MEQVQIEGNSQRTYRTLTEHLPKLVDKVIEVIEKLEQQKFR